MAFRTGSLAATLAAGLVFIGLGGCVQAQTFASLGPLGHPAAALGASAIVASLPPVVDPTGSAGRPQVFASLPVTHELTTGSISAPAFGSPIASVVRTRAAAREAQPRLAPLAFVKFCRSYPGECVAQGESDARVPLTPENRLALRQLNQEVNARIAADRFLAGSEAIPTWRLSPSRGNCNDYAVTKRHELLEQGVPSSALLLAAVETRTGEPHLVLIVKGTDDDVVLDNLTSDIRPWSRTGYRTLTRQASRHPMMWES